MHCCPLCFLSRLLVFTANFQLLCTQVKSTLGPFLLHSNSLEHSEKILDNPLPLWGCLVPTKHVWFTLLYFLVQDLKLQVIDQNRE